MGIRCIGIFWIEIRWFGAIAVDKEKEKETELQGGIFSLYDISMQRMRKFKNKKSKKSHVAIKERCWVVLDRFFVIGYFG